MVLDCFELWQRTLGSQSEDFKPQTEFLRQAFLNFRERTAQLIGEIGPLLPGLTVHDITHVDALWRVVNEIAGPEYPLNPAEAFVLGGSFLLHDAAHVLAAYEDGLEGIKQTIEWKDLVAHRFESNEPLPGSPEERSALFQVLRHLHAKQAHRLAKVCWTVPSDGANIYLLEHFELREYYGSLIGEIAASHHWEPLRVVETFTNRHLSPPSFLAPTKWSVDALKIAFLLRTADAAHIDGRRAPWFLFALRCPSGLSHEHWLFQAKMGQPVRTDRGELRLSSGSPFPEKDRQAWWLAYDTACLIDKEIRQAQMLLRDAGRPPFATVSVEHVATSQAFATNVLTSGWEPIDVGPKIGDVSKVIRSLGGTKLYGRRPELALRELIQNAADAVRARRALGELGQKEGEIEVALAQDGQVTWLHVTDTGIGMSRFVLTEVLLDFGNSLWDSEALRSELPGLAAQRFCAVGQFGIGFFSVFMLGKEVKVTTYPCSRGNDATSEQWLLEFGHGLYVRPSLRRPNSKERLSQFGTRISVAMDAATLERLLIATNESRVSIYDLFRDEDKDAIPWLSKKKTKLPDIREVILNICPTLDIDVIMRISQKKPVRILRANDWVKLKPEHLLCRVPRSGLTKLNPKTLLDLREDSGMLVGRVSYSGSLDEATITFGGIKSGSVQNLFGVLLGINNSDLVRSKSRPIASRDAWAKWASEWIDKFGGTEVDTLAALHLFCPERDLPLYRVEDKILTEAQLTKWLRAHNEVYVLEGFPYREDDDEVSVDSFRQYFKLNPEILVLPSPRDNFSKSLTFSKINYTARLEAVLQSVWGDGIDWDGADEVVGDVNGTEIYRLTIRYVRVVEDN
ncbi:ATPase [Geoanaerobacter pelophilus]|uniref:ATPase n=1 Tax=Geoanaerobacter pelophilus TaxID=60036 RepID=A0ABQ0MLM8_9BACT|nr:ATP-binding protein [Geoanaerobacter pelophilus]GAW67984.1 ATPase [Geoanaerobacter pelophilus]